MKGGFIGCGNMGNPMASNLIKAGHQLTVHDLRRDAATNLLEAGASWADTPKDAVGGNDVVFTSLPVPRDVEAVVLGENGILEGSSSTTIYMDLSTNSPTMIRRIHDLCAEKGVAVLDAPVSGGVYGAAAATLAVMVGGEREIFDRIKPLLDAFGDKVFYAGSIGAGSVAKLVHNMIGHGVRQAIAEGLTLGVKAGVEPEALWQCVRRGSLGRMSGLHEGIARTVFRGEFEPASFSLALSRKDVGLATDLGREFNVPMPLANLVEQIAIEGMNRGWGDKDSSVTFLLQEEQAGVEVRAPHVDPAQAARFISTHPEA